jgi:hypothetical protein
MKLITELSENVEYKEEIIDEATGKKNLYITGPFMQYETPNRNGRIYPKSIMENEVNRYKREIIENNRAYGELNHPCFWKETKALTDSGWKYIKDITLDDQVLSLNKETGKSEFVPVEKTHINPFKEKMLRFKNRTFNTLVTPYHRFIVEYRDGSKHFLTAKEIKEMMDNRISKLAKFCIPKNSEYIQEKTKTININDINFNFNDFVSFLGLYLAEGCTSYISNKNYYKIQLFQNEGYKANKIRNLLKKFPIKFSEYQKDGKIIWSSYNRQLGKYLHKFGKAHEKYIDNDIIKKLDSEASEQLFSWFCLGDGRSTGSGIYKESSREVFTTSKRLAENLSVVAVKAGYAYRKYEYLEENDVIIENRIIKAGTKKTLYYVKLLTSNNIWLDKRHLTIEEENYDGDVYCLTTKHGTFLAEDSGYCFWTGNCGATINLDKVCILIKELDFQNNGKVFGKALVTNTPCGQIVKGLMESGANLGVSTRGLGSLKARDDGINEVQNDFRLVTAADVVADPSAPAAFVNGIMEGIEFVKDERTGEWIQEKKKELKKMTLTEMEDVRYRFFSELLEKLSK